MESGVICMDKGRPGVFFSTVLAAWMNTGDIRPDIYKDLHGDKETYWLATELTATSYHFVAEYAGSVRVLNNSTSICGPQVAHSDSAGRLFWVDCSLRRDKRRSRDLAVFTHWQRGMSSFPGNGSWVMDSAARWCLNGSAPILLSEVGLDSVMQASLREMQRIEDSSDCVGWNETFSSD
ncbi:MAG: hypothetical protein M1838_003501 [Thelocarpon superellum]|nr:MAG: hypothetical protein M1838_003501 [Thelocarpon superellum]